MELFLYKSAQHLYRFCKFLIFRKGFCFPKPSDTLHHSTFCFSKISSLGFHRLLKKDKLYFCNFQSQKNLYFCLSIYFTESKRHEKKNHVLLMYISDFFGQHIINMIYHLSLSLSNVHFFSYYGACHFSKRKKVMRNQCKVLSYPPLFSGAVGMSTATPSASEFEAVHLQFSLPVWFPLRALLSSLFTPPPSLPPACP